MVTLSKKFTVNANQDILSLLEIQDAIKIKFGDSAYNQLVKEHKLTTDFDIFFDSDVKVQFRFIYNKDTGLWEDLIGGSVYPYASNTISQIIPQSNATGLIFFKRY